MPSSGRDLVPATTKVWCCRCMGEKFGGSATIPSGEKMKKEYQYGFIGGSLCYLGRGRIALASQEGEIFLEERVTEHVTQEDRKKRGLRARIGSL